MTPLVDYVLTPSNPNWDEPTYFNPTGYGLEAPAPVFEVGASELPGLYGLGAAVTYNVTLSAAIYGAFNFGNLIGSIGVAAVNCLSN